MSEDTTTAAAASAQQEEWEQREAQIRERALFQTVVIIEDVQFLLDQLQAEREHNRKLREAAQAVYRAHAAYRENQSMVYYDLLLDRMLALRALLDDSEAMPQTDAAEGHAEQQQQGQG